MDCVAGVASCSAGTCVALTHLSGRAEETHAYWRERCVGLTSNFDWSKLLRGERPAPQYEIYPDTMMHLAAEGGLERIRALPFPVLILAARLPRGVPAPAARSWRSPPTSSRSWCGPRRCTPPGAEPSASRPR